MDKDSKTIIIGKIRNGLSKARFKDGFAETTDKNLIYNQVNKPLLEIFKEEFLKISGEFYYFETEESLIQHMKNVLPELQPVYCSDKNLINYLEKAQLKYSTNFTDDINTGISACEFLIARFGSVMVSSALAGARKVFSYPHTHIVIAYEKQLVAELEDGLDGIAEKYKGNLPSQIISITGPSRTADIEKTLIMGAHGPKKLMVFVLKDKF